MDRSTARAGPTPRWDSIAATRLPERGERPWLGFFTANALEAPRGASGCVGMAESANGVHWEALPPPLEPGLFANCEVVEHCRFGERHYLLFTSNTAAGIRFDRRARSNAGGTYYVVGDAAEGPYHLPPGDPMLQGTWDDRNVFALCVGSPLRLDDGTLLYGHHWAREHRPPNGSWGPAKQLLEVEPWRLGLAWWPGNEVLKAEPLGDASGGDGVEPEAPFGGEPVCAWRQLDDALGVMDCGGCGAATWHHRASSGDGGRVIEAGVRIDAGAAIGVWCGTTPRSGLIDGPVPGMGPRSGDHRLAVLLDQERQEVAIVRLMRSLGPSLVVQESLAAVQWPIDTGVTHRLRILVRGECLECYLDDRYVHGLSLAEGFDTACLGLVGDRADGLVRDARVWAMPKTLGSI